MADTCLPSFDDFYRATNEGRHPLPWQSRLASQVASTGWPTSIEIPTGLGKTTCIDIAVWSLATQAGVPATERALATRTWYVVNRRLLVDAAYDRGCQLRDMLDAAVQSDVEDDDAIKRVADALVSIRGVGGIDDLPLVVSRLRGAADLGQRPAHPAQPALIFATVPMFASSWLFRGYASSHSMRPVDASHAGIDSLVLLDEAHLARPLQQLVHPVEQCDVGDPSAVLPAGRGRPKVVSLTATGDADDPFLLDSTDEANEIVRRRLDAPKPTRLVSVNKPADRLAQALAEEVTAELAPRPEHVAAVVFTNTAKSARELFDELNKRAKKDITLSGADIVLLTGRMRGPDADLIRAQVTDPVTGAPSGRPIGLARAQHLIVVATQTLEVGADLDFDVLVTESTGARSLIQRLGRLNRLGEKPNPAAVIVHPTAQTADWPVYGSEPAEVWSRLGQELGLEKEVLDLRPRTVHDIVGTPGDEPPRVAQLLPAHLWEWAKTTTPPPGEAPVEPFFEGFASEGPRLTLCWRAFVPTRDDPANPLSNDRRLVPSIAADETIDLPLKEAKDRLIERFDRRQVCRIADNRVEVEMVDPARLRPSDIAILSVDDGLYDSHGWAPDFIGPVDDLSVTRWPGLPLDIGLRLIRHCVDTSSEPQGPLERLKELVVKITADDDDGDLDRLAIEATSLLAELTPRPSMAVTWDSLVTTTKPKIDRAAAPPMLRRHVAGKARRATQLIAADSFDDLSSIVPGDSGTVDVMSVGLADHLASVGRIAGEIGRALGLPGALVSAVEASGRFHDLGKADSRFQRWLDPNGEQTDLVAKSDTPRSRWRADRATSGWPRGGRHETLSARLIEAWLEADLDHPWDADLVLHLAISHHGFGRPFVAPVPDSTALDVTAVVDGTAVTATANLGEVDWDQPARFRRCCEHYGYWGLALLEAVVRQADHIASGLIAHEPIEVA